MPWEIPIVQAKALEEFNRRIERLPAVIPEPYYDPPTNYYNYSKSYSSFVPYDVFYNFEEGFDPKSSRDDRKSLKPMFENIFKDEEKKYIPVTSNLCYGRPLLFEKVLDFSTTYYRPGGMSDFFSLQGINISPDLEKKPDNITK